MSRLMSGHRGSLAHWTGLDRARNPLARRGTHLGASPNLLVVGVVAIGVGALAWHFLGPDVRRYMKIREM